MVKITETAQKVLEERYFLKGETKWEDVASRVACWFGATAKEQTAFMNMLSDMDGLPNSPTLMNAGTDIEAYSACYVLPVEDSIESIFKYYSDAGLISKSGGGVGANFSAIRSAGTTVNSTDGVASGPISFMKGQDALTDVIKQGGRRRGANMGILECDHPDAMDFIKAKDEAGVLENFNLSVGITDKFMEKVMLNSQVNTYPEEKAMWDEIIQRAWSSAEPGVLFMDVAERQNTVPHLGKLKATNPCGEQWLLDYESCTLGSINLSNHVALAKDKRVAMYGPVGIKTVKETNYIVDWDKLRETTKTMTLLLNRILDKSEMPIPECQAAMELTRKIGVGIMGLHDMLIQLGLPYNSEEGRQLASEVMKFVAACADEESTRLGKLQGCYAGWEFPASIDGLEVPRRRNANLTTIAPTGTLSMLADCSSGCEPYYAPVTYKTVLDGTEFAMYNKWLPEKEQEYIEKGFGLSDEGRKLFKGAEDIHWRDHIKMQAALQIHVDSSISKTINMPNDATKEDIDEAYKLAWRLGCKGVTVYRDGSRAEQVLSTEGGAGEVGGDRGENIQAESKDDTLTVSHQPVPYKMDLPDELNSRRYRLRDSDRNKIYFNVCTFDGQPVEVFAKGSELVSGSYWNTICRLLSLCMRYNIPLDDIKKQLRKSSDSVSDMPSRLARILDKYDEPEESQEASEDVWEAVLSPAPQGMSLEDKPDLTGRHSTGCPECLGSLTPGGGCMYCENCGWSKCA